MVIAVSFNSGVGPSTRNKFFSRHQHLQKDSYLLQNLFLPNPPAGNKTFSFISNPIPYPKNLYLSISTFFIDLTAPDKEFYSVRSPIYT